MKNTLKKLLGNSNSKLKKTSKFFNVEIYNFSIPSGNDKRSGKITCPFADTCLDLCYADKGFYRFSNVQRGLSDRYDATKESNFVNRIINEISSKKTKKQIYVRIHDSGDFYSPTYLDKWIEISKQLPNVRFYAYTKSHDFFRGLTLPNNFDVIFSLGSKLDIKLDRFTERHAEIFNTKKELDEAGYVDSSSYDLYATKWHNNNSLKVGLILH